MLRVYSNLPSVGARLSAIAALLTAGCAHQRVEPVMSFDEYTKIHHDTPYVLRITEGDLELIYYGARHSFDTADPMFDDIERRFTAMRPTIAFNEGGDPPALSDRDEAIRNYGDSGFLRYMAKTHGVEAQNLDLPPEHESRILRSKYTKPQVLLFYVVRQLGTYNNMPDPPDFDTYFDEFMQSCGRSLEMHDASWEIVNTEFERTFGEPLIPERIGRDYSDPVPDENLTQRIARDSSIARDQYMVDKLVEALHRHKRVFAVMGASHVVMQEQALRARVRLRRHHGEVDRPHSPVARLTI